MKKEVFNSPYIDCLCACEVDETFIKKCISAGVAAINKCICTDESMYAAIKGICNYRQFLETHSDIALLVRKPEDIERAYNENKVGIMMGFQNTIPLEYDARLVDIYADAGVSIIQLTYNYRNLVGVGVMEEKPGGLSEYGHEVIDRLNRAKIIIDLSHASEP
ncbi:MAG TPA: membrane dipeptidase, partial [Anaerovoracaceae bacterium]|nr:membrane dipeptidase [Anaerovoracaceae bacterium]